MSPRLIILILSMSLLIIEGAQPQSFQTEEYWYQKVPNNHLAIDRILSTSNSEFHTIATDTMENGNSMTAARFHQFWRHRANDLSAGHTHCFSKADQYLDRRYMSYQEVGKSASFDNTWEYIGRDSSSSHSMGIVISLAVDTTGEDLNTIFAGTNASGLWKTVDGGKQWFNITDGLGLPGLGVNDIDIDPLDPNTIYICTGVTTFMRGYGVGIWKSVDGGDTWERIWDIDVNNQLIYNLLINPEEPENLLALVNDKVYRSKDGGANWSNIFSNITQPHSWKTRRILDATFSPLSSNTFFLVSEGTQQFLSDTIIDYTPEIWTTSDVWADSVNWIRIENETIWPYTRRASIDMSQVSPETLYCSFSYNNEGKYMLLSYDLNEQTWHEVLDTLAEDFLIGVDEWCNEFEVSDTDSSVFYVGGLYMTRISGKEIEQTGEFISESFHVDVRDLMLVESSLAGTAGAGDVLFVANDGGISKSTDGARSWEGINGKGLRITQYFDLALSEEDDKFWAGGTQDNGLIVHNPALVEPWALHFLGDNYSTIINSSEPEYIYSLLYDYEGPGILISDDGGETSYCSESFPSDEYVTLGWPLESDPALPNTLYAGLRDGYRSDDHALTWYKVSDFTSSPHLLPENEKVEDLKVFEQDNNIIYLSFYGRRSADHPKKLFKTLDGGENWVDLGGQLDFLDQFGVSSICIDPRDHHKVWLTLGGFSDDETMRVIYTDNSFETYTDISEGLPGFPVTCVKAVEGQLIHLYLCNDLGVYYRNDTMSSWTEYGVGLPVCIVSDLEYHYEQNKVRIATFGRGLWEIDGVQPEFSINEIELPEGLEIWPVPTSSSINVRLPLTGQRYSIITFDMYGRRMGDIIVPDGQVETSLNVSDYPGGLYIVVLESESGLVSKGKFVVARY